MDGTILRKLAVPAVLSLIAFLAYSSQLLFLQLEPGPLDRRQSLIFNALVGCLLICYMRACRTDPGRVPEGWQPRVKTSKQADDNKHESTRETPKSIPQRWCRKCEAPKPPRAHHCRLCQRCILKMDHHCPWTLNCVSHRVFPHFIRFLFYAVAAMTCLGYFLYLRAALIFQSRNLPSYLGPSVLQLTHLFLLLLTTFLTWTALTILLLRTAYSLFTNTTTIESWELERHATLLHRARHFGGVLDGPDGQRIPIRKQEFPYDIGIWRNCVQGMGAANPLAWFWPFAASPSVESGLEFEVNGFESEDAVWPPPDPDRMARGWPRPWEEGRSAFVHGDEGVDVEAFRRRQEQDIKRWRRDGEGVVRRKPFVERLEASVRWEQDGDGDGEEGEQSEDSDEDEVERRPVAVNVRGEESWKNSEGESLADFGLDEDAEFYDEEDIPLSVLLQRKRLQKAE
ncbi:zf-DHHC-domain-containing protein [Viridothelium virens]|uniref:Palmitoyltransferase PFA4 n=1 Tax=Viridothelium virens TaxID=1048519 RepID=A0A6A6H8U8_VIRVR|nr:zf-DHHC-domain-containing protein [Viridothelium virens]